MWATIIKPTQNMYIASDKIPLRDTMPDYKTKVRNSPAFRLSTSTIHTVAHYKRKVRNAAAFYLSTSTIHTVAGRCGTLRLSPIYFYDSHSCWKVRNSAAFHLTTSMIHTVAGRCRTPRLSTYLLLRFTQLLEGAELCGFPPIYFYDSHSCWKVRNSAAFPLSTSMIHTVAGRCGTPPLST